MAAAAAPLRALAVAGAGVAAIVASQGFGTPPLATLGAGLISLPVLVTAAVWLAATGMRVERRLAPARCTAGDEVRVEVRRVGWAVRAGLDRLLDVDVDPGLGAALGGGTATRRGDAWTATAARGDHLLPPPRVTVRDPFGLALRARDGGGEDRLMVVPAAPAIGHVPRGSRVRGRGPRRRRADGGFGELDRVREYQPGDPLSRVHWAQTAKRGRLQTKELRAAEGTGRSTLVLLDGAVPSGEDFETAVSAAAALALHLCRSGEPPALCVTGPRPARLPRGRASWTEIEIALARAEAWGVNAPAPALLGAATGPDAPETAIVVTSSAPAGLVPAVARLRAHGTGVAVVLTGPAAAAAGDLAAVGAEVVVIPGPDRVASALSAAPAPPRAAAAR